MKINNLVDVVSLGTPCSSQDIQEIKAFLSTNNFQSNIFLEQETTIAKTNPHEFATINSKIRFEQFRLALENPDSKIIWCSRGGYGSAEIINYLSTLARPKQTKLFIGFSDISSINIFLQQNWNYPSVIAPMLIQCALNKVSKQSIQTIIEVILGKINQFSYSLINLKNLEYQAITGQVVGGCVSVIAGNFATKNQLNWHNKILFLEDEGEDGERLDRYFQQISTIIFESKLQPKAIVLGNFMQGNCHGTPKQKNIEIAINNFANKTQEIPFFIEQSFCLGHSFEMMPLGIGIDAKIVNNQLHQTIIV